MIAFTVPGDARGKGRPRATIRGSHASLYTDAKTASYENLVKMTARIAMAGRAPLDEALSMRISVRMVPAPSHSARKRAAMLAGEVAPTKLPDLDNIIKAVLDGCNKVAFRDDALVVRLSAQKAYAETAGVDVTIIPARRAS